MIVVNKQVHYFFACVKLLNVLFSLISQTCNSVHSLCFHHSGQKNPAVESSSICACTGSQPKCGTASRGFSLVPVRKRLSGATRWENRCSFSILLHSKYAFSSLPPHSAQLSRLQLSPPVHPSLGKAKALCTRELHPGSRVGWTMEQLCSSCIAVSLPCVW